MRAADDGDKRHLGPIGTTAPRCLADSAGDERRRFPGCDRRHARQTVHRAPGIHRVLHHGVRHTAVQGAVKRDDRHRRRWNIGGQSHKLIQRARGFDGVRTLARIGQRHVAALGKPGDEGVVGVFGRTHAVDHLGNVVVVLISRDARIVGVPPGSRVSRGIAGKRAGDHDEARLVGLAMEHRPTAERDKDHGRRAGLGEVVGPVDIVGPLLLEGSPIGVGGV